MSIVLCIAEPTSLLSAVLFTSHLCRSKQQGLRLFVFAIAKVLMDKTHPIRETARQQLIQIAKSLAWNL